MASSGARTAKSKACHPYSGRCGRRGQRTTTRPLGEFLAAAMDPGRRDAVRQAFIQTVKQMDPMDALVLKVIHENGGAQWSPNGRQFVEARLKCSGDEVIVSSQHLGSLDCVYFTDSTGPRIMPYMSPFGKLLMNAVRPVFNSSICKEPAAGTVSRPGGLPQFGLGGESRRPRRRRWSGASSTPGRAHRPGFRRSEGRADEKAYAVVLDLGLGQGIQIGDDLRP